ncbi:hypothetical protein B0T24DRAFT_627051 [Lasiosphaeria ovina]|uniref:Uncharacterized protein n=1 Tax=Lasiosphaeria ovina TaxID=92902 RepID=A0AAE0K736_9PEZI|nr:hypothetical protein B0T24DRAFT_627051 [Lasiosphaeria ovina]
MVKLANIAIAIVAAIAGTEATFTQACNAPYDVCGWILTNGVYGYDQATLQAAALAAGQSPTTSQLYNGLYGCRDDGAIIWKQLCTSGCQPPVTFNSFCN